MSSKPFWEHGNGEVCNIANVEFTSTVVNPVGQTESPVMYPLLIYFCGLGSSDLDCVGMDLEAMSRITSQPFVLVVPLRPPQTWWVLDNHRAPWGFVDGSLMTTEVDNYCRWISTLAATPGIDAASVSLFGNSAGAYAVTEIMAGNMHIRLNLVGICAVHGHGQPDLDGLGIKRKKNSRTITDKWHAYINRLSSHRIGPVSILAIHNKEDTGRVRMSLAPLCAF